ncbi:MAG: indolepyruvate oxidoreductase subunit beta [Deltaproteobacteria bacterium]|nr:indolepyruvate oxidoreductase subunit beta [Deltaproteobacteria bacterium]MBW2216423.1 indolepyruvate oxidoreductase subunit beta [Deltaproteobacteria bacterium]
MDKVTNILMVGVGGQGVILASEIVAEVMMHAGFDVKKSEVHGMAQRGGMVNSHIRFGPKVYSPVIKKGEADILFSFEQLETLRFIEYLVDDPVILIAGQKILPPSVTAGNEVYPSDIPGRLSERYPRVELVDSIGIAGKAGNIKASNVALLGALSKHFNLDIRLWEETISLFVPPDFLDVNLKAFSMGRNHV